MRYCSLRATDKNLKVFTIQDTLYLQQKLRIRCYVVVVASECVIPTTV